MEDNNKFDKTIQTYKDKFDTYTERTPSEMNGESKEWADSFLMRLPENSKILEFGSATGRDARYFKSKGFEVTCTDIIPEALKNLEEEGFKTEVYDFRDNPKEEWRHSFDGFFANGVFVHASQEVLEKNLKNISEIIKPNGYAAISLKNGVGDEISERKLEAPVYYKYYTEPELREIILKSNFEISELTYSHEGIWMRLILELKK